jgi:hypothetical protein
MAARPLVLLHGYSADDRAFSAWCAALRAAGWRDEQLCVVSYESLTNEVSVRDIAEAFDKLLRQRAGLDADAPFDVMVHSTGMLVLRAWLTRPGSRAARRARLKHVVALAPATFGSPLAHKGRSFLGALVKGRKQLGPDFLEAGDQVLDALELGSRFTWELAHHDLFGTETFYDGTRETPYVFVFCGTKGFGGVSGAFANTPGTDGTVRWAGCALNSRKLVLDLTDECAPAARVQACDWTQDDVPLHPVAGVDHGAILSKPPAWLVERVVAALGVSTKAAYVRWSTETDQAVRVAREALTPWQQFVVRAVDERGDPIPDWNLQLALRDGTQLTPFSQDVHVYGADASLRTFHVRLDALKDPALLSGKPRQLTAQLYASTGTGRVLYRGALTGADGAEAPGKAGTWFGTLDLSNVLPGGALSFFHPFTTTFVEVRLDRDPLTGGGAVARWGGP